MWGTGRRLPLAGIAGRPYRFKDTGGSRDTHETGTRTSQTNLKTNPTHNTLTHQLTVTRQTNANP
jgi:hypothetical protein